ncbi:hypothetical protein CLU79DRAFT_460116 [Phycomyces nitens]|nr:hypothetical protein CLU79DRAFT_460116 [Phycomyces nitens]
MQEKTEQEAETRGRLKHLLGLILTGPTSRSSKVPQNQFGYPSATASVTAAVADIPVDTKELTINYLLERSTMQDVVARLEEGLSIQIDMHDEQMKQMDKKLLGYKNSLTSSQSIQRQQAKELEECHVKIEESEQRIRDLQVALRSVRQQERTPRLEIKSSTPDVPQSPIQRLEQELKQVMLKKDSCTCESCRNNKSESIFGSSALNQLQVGNLAETEAQSEPLDIENLLSRKDAKIKDLLATVKQSEQEIKDMTTTQLKSLEQKDQTIADLNLALAEAQQEAENVFITIDRVEDSFCLEAQRVELEKKIFLLEERCQEQQEQVDIRNSQMLRLEEELAEARAMCVEQQADLDLRHERMVELEAQVRHAQAQVELAEAEAQRLESTRNAQMNELANSVEKYRAEVQLKADCVNQLQDDLSRANKTLAEYEKDIIALNSRCSHFESDMEDARKMATLSQEEIKARLIQVSVLEKDLLNAREMCARQEQDTLDKNNKLLLTIEASLGTVQEIERQVESKDRTIEALGVCIREQADRLEYLWKTELKNNDPCPVLSEKQCEAMSYDQFSQLCDRIQANPDSLEGKLALQWLQDTRHNINDIQDDEENDTRSMHPSLSIRSHPPPYSHATDGHEYHIKDIPEEYMPYSQSIDSSPSHFIILLLGIVVLYSFL